MTPEIEALCGKLWKLSGYLAASGDEEAFPIIDQAAAKLREMARAAQTLLDAMDAIPMYGGAVQSDRDALRAALAGGSHG